MSNEITAYFKGTTGVAESVYQHDYGMIMNIDGLTLSNTFDVHFEKSGSSSTITTVGSNNRVAIPNDCLAVPGKLTAYIYTHTGSHDGETAYVVTFQVINRARPDDDITDASEENNAKAIVRLQTEHEADVFKINNNLDAIENNIDDVEAAATALTTRVTTAEGDIDSLEAQFTTVVSAVTTDTEVTNIRVGDDGVTYSTAGEAVRNQFSNVKAELNMISAETKNLADLDEVIIGKAWNGDSNANRASLFIPMEVGTKYTVSFATNPFDAIYAYDKASIEATSYLTSTKLTSSGYSSTAPTGAHYLCLGFNKTAISKSDFEGIKLQVEIGDSATDYVPHIGAVDYMLREQTDSFYDAVYSNNLSDKLVMVGSMRGETDASIRRGYRLFTSDDGINFNLSSLQLPSGLDQTAGAPFAFQYGEWFIVGTHKTDDYDENNTDKGCLQCFATKDLRTWVESIVFFPTDVWSEEHYAGSLFTDISGNLLYTWSYKYRSGTIPNAVGGNSSFFKPCYISLSMSTDGELTSDRTLHLISGIPETDGDGNYTSYIDPSIVYASVLYAQDDVTRESRICVAIKNEITSQIELWIGADFTSMTLVRTYLGHGVEAPTIFYDYDTNVFSVYGSGYLYGSMAIDLLLYDSFNFADRLSKGMWSLAEYYSNSRIRHPYISQISKNIAERLNDYPIIPSIPYPSERHVNLKISSGVLVGADGADKNYQFVPHPRIKYYITGTTSGITSNAYEIAPIQGKDLTIVFYLNANIEAKILLGDGFGSLRNKYLTVLNPVKAHANVTFKEFDSNVFTPIWCADIYTLNNLIEE